MRAAILGIVGAIGLAASDAVLAEQGEDLGFSDAQTARAVETFNNGADGCEAAPVEYRADCFQQVFGQTARGIAKASAYWEAEVALTRVKRSLYTFVRSNTDSNASRKKINGARAKAVTQAAIPQARALFQASVDQAVGVLQNGSAAEKRFFQPIAEAVAARRDALN